MHALPTFLLPSYLILKSDARDLVVFICTTTLGSQGIKLLVCLLLTVLVFLVFFGSLFPCFLAPLSLGLST